LVKFWYTDEFSLLMAREAISLGGSRKDESTPIIIICIACPSIFQAIRKSVSINVTSFILEFDHRFSVYAPSFIFYDFHAPLSIPQHLHHSADFIILDPPYLNPDCLNHVMQSVHLLEKLNGSSKIIANTGAILREKLERIYNMKPVKTQPTHKVQIMNPFLCYTNYNAQQLGGWIQDTET